MQIISTKSDISNHSILSVYFNQLVIGSTKDAVQFAYNNRYKLISCNDRTPEIFDPDLDEWHETVSLLSLGGYIPFGDSVQKLIYDDEDGTIILLTKGEQRYIVHYKEIYVFDLENLDNFYFLDKEDGEDMVLDYLKITGRTSNTAKFPDIVRHGERHIQRITSYLIRNACQPLAVSVLPQDHYKLEEYSENTTRLLTQRIMRSEMNRDKIMISWESRKVIPTYKIKKLDGCPANIIVTSDLGVDKQEYDIMEYIKYLMEARWQNLLIT